MSPVEMLRAARELLTNPENFCQEVCARDKNGEPVYPKNPTAVRWCALGALYKVAKLEASDEARRFLPHDMTRINDIEGHAAVLRTYDKVIAAAEAQE